MSLKSSRIAGFLSSLLLTTTAVTACFAQPAWNYDRIVSCTDDADNNAITMSTMKGAEISPPTIHYLPGPNGRAMMVADFTGLSYIMPPHIIHPVQTPGKWGIEEIRVGQFQVNPPICRIAAISRNPASLKGLSFTANSGTLIVKWTGARGLIPDPVEVAVAPAKTVEDTQSPVPAPEAKPATEPKPAPTRTPAKAPVQAAKPTSIAPAQGATRSAQVATRSTQVATRSTQVATRPNPKALNDDDDVEASIQHIKDLLEAARRSKVVPGKVQAPNQLQAHAVPAVAPAEQNNKLLTTPSQDQVDATDTIKKPVPPVAPSIKKKAIDDTGETPENSDLLNKEKSDDLRVDKKNEKPPGVPMARLSVVSDTEAKEPNAAIQVLAERNITYKSFRLHSPERYIIDLEKPADLDEATVSLFQDNALCRSVRIGMMDKKTCRLVFDLAGDNVQVQEKTFAEDGTVLTLKIFSQAPTVMTKSNPNLPLEGVSLVLDAGHGGSDPGAQRGEAREKEMTLGIINQLKKRLEASGAFITMTRTDDTFVSLEDRVKITNLVMPKAFVSVHINALESTNDIKGVETYFQTEQSRPLAEAIHNSLYTSLGVPNRGIRKARFYVINHTTVPAILAEVGYISNKDEREKLISSDYQGKIADALAQGVILYVNKNPETQANTVKTAPVINFNQSAGKGTSVVPIKSVAESLSVSGSNAVRAVK
ncbi:MAG: N-acetylmuramoyl-L-alanine amidase [Candidatus Melainabacteria bacterium]|nr:N-acetylmuramoyl-L-alanine amidase [Candidatus Melainabacteria bacterium]